MKNTCRLNKFIILILSSVLAGVFFVSCGLEEVIVVNAPTEVIHHPLYTSEDYTTLYCHFETANDDNLLGTNVYYKIYNNSSSLISDRDNINTLSSSSSSSSTAYDSMTSTYKYQQLTLTYLREKNSKQTVLNESITVPSATNTDVYFRTKSIPNAVSPVFMGGISYPYNKEAIRFRAADSNNSIRWIIFKESTNTWYDTDNNEIDFSNYCLIVPSRYNNCSFDFFDEDGTGNSDYFKEPENGDDDFSYSSSPTEDKTYFVQFFAVSVAWDSNNVKNIYSIPLDIGSVRIVSGKL